MRRARAACAAFTALVVALCAVAVPAGAAVFPANGASLGAIPDGDPGAPLCGDFPAASRSVTFSVSNQTAPLTDVRVSMTGTHPLIGDLRVQLISPGSVVTHLIFSRTGAVTAAGCGDLSDLGGPYVFADTAPAVPTWWQAAAATANVPIPPGSFRSSVTGGAPAPPAGDNTLITPAFAGLTTAQVNGTWTLRVADGGETDLGSITAASLGLNGPAAPQLISNPVTPADNNAPNVTGFADAGTQTALFMTPDCTGAAFATLTDAQLASTGAPIAVGDNSTATVSGRTTDSLGAASGCSAPYTYVEDSVPPATPALTGTDPGSPGLSVQPRVRGSSEAETAVRIYPSGDCSGAPLAAGPDSQLAGAGIEITVGVGSTTQLSARATDTAGLSSGCSTPISYTQGGPADNTPPETSLEKTPKKKSGDDTPTFKAVSSEPGSTFRCKVDKKPFKACEAKTTFDLEPGKHTVQFAAVDPAGNVDQTPAKFKFKIKG